MTKEQAIEDKIHGLYEDATAAFEKGNRTAAYYLASLCGMWAHYLKQPYNNRFANDDVNLYRWFSIGFDCSNQARGMNDKIREEQAKKEAKQDAKRVAAQMKIAEAASGEPKGSFFKLKLW